MALALGALFASACSSGRGDARETLTAYLAAVQAEDLARLRCLVAGAEQAGEEEFADWASRRYEAYLEGRDAGRIELDDQGVALVKLFALGKGTFFDIAAVSRPAEEVLAVDTELRFAYAHLDLSGFSPGTTLYMAGAPAGRVYALRVPEGGGEMTHDLLDSVRVRWTLARAEPAGGCPGGWTVASAEPVEGSEQTLEVTWIF